MDMILYSLLLTFILIHQWIPVTTRSLSIPQYCTETNEREWSCSIESNTKQINCNQIDNIKTNPAGITVTLTIKEIDSSRHLNLFDNVESCTIEILRIGTKQIPSNRVFYNLKSLKRLFINSFDSRPNERSVIPNDLLAGLDKLDQLRIHDFLIPLLGKDIFRSCSMVTDIYLKNLEIESIDFKAFINCKRLIKLTIKINKISKLIISSFDGLFELIDLFLPSNGIEVLLSNGHSWMGVGKLKTLDLSDNLIKELSPRIFNGLHGLQKLSLKGNQLMDISKEAFYGLNELVSLNLRDNHQLKQLDLVVLSIAKERLMILDLDSVYILCLKSRELLETYKDQVRAVLQPVVQCGFRSQTTSSSKQPGDSPVFVIGSQQMTLILTVTILITVLIFVAIAFTVYCVITKSKIRNYRRSATNSLHNSGAGSRFNGTIATSRFTNEDTYEQFEALSSNPRSQSNSTT